MRPTTGSGRSAGSRETTPPLHAQLVDLPGVVVQAVGDLPQRGQRLGGVGPLERGQLVAVVAQDLGEPVVHLDQLLLVVGQLGHVCLISPSVPMTIRSSRTRLAFSSNRGSVPT